MATGIIEPKQKIFLPFGISRLDLDLEGIPAQDFCLVCGGTHTGKSVFAFNFLLDGLKKEETVALVSSIPPEEVLDQSDVLQLPIRDYVEAGKLILLYQKTQHPHLIHDKEDLIAVTSALEEELLPWEPSRLVFDSFVPFMSFFHPDFRENGLLDAFRRLRHLGLTVMLTTRMPRSSDALNMRGFVERRSSCYFYLDEHRPPNGNPIRRLVVRKIQGMQPPYPVYNFVIEKGSGINVYERMDTPLEKPQESSGTEAAQRKEKEPSKTPSHQTPLEFRDNIVLKERLEEDEGDKTTAEEVTPAKQNNILFLAEKENLDIDESAVDISAFPPFRTEESQPHPQKNDFSFLDLGYDALDEEEKEKETDNAELEPETQADKADSLEIKREKISFSDYSLDLVDKDEIQEPDSDVVETADVESEPTSDARTIFFSKTGISFEADDDEESWDYEVSAWPTAAEITYGQTLAQSELEGGQVMGVDGEPLAGTFEWTDDSIAPQAGAEQVFNVTFISNEHNYNFTAGNVKIDVAKAMPNVIEWPTATEITYGKTLAESELTGGIALGIDGKFLLGSFAWTYASFSPQAGAQQAFSVTFTPDNDNYCTAAGDVMIDVAKQIEKRTYRMKKES